MLLTRREFLKASAVTAGVAITGMGFAVSPVEAHAAQLRKNLQEATRTTTICPYCGVGCGFVVDSAVDPDTGEMRVINIEGDSEHPINQGTACSKGSSLYQMAAGNNENRLDKVLYRAAGGTEWEEKSWDWAIGRIAEKIKETRDANFETSKGNEEGAPTVNRTTAIGSLGSAALDNEECWLYQKFLRALGLVYIEHQARN